MIMRWVPRTEMTCVFNREMHVHQWMIKSLYCLQVRVLFNHLFFEHFMRNSLEQMENIFVLKEGSSPVEMSLSWVFHFWSDSSIAGAKGGVARPWFTSWNMKIEVMLKMRLTENGFERKTQRMSSDVFLDEMFLMAHEATQVLFGHLIAATRHRSGMSAACYPEFAEYLLAAVVLWVEGPIDVNSAESHRGYLVISPSGYGRTEFSWRQ